VGTVAPSSFRRSRLGCPAGDVSQLSRLLPADDVSRLVPRTPFLYFLCGLVEISSNRFSRHPFCAVRAHSRSSSDPLVFTLFAFPVAPGIHFAESQSCTKVLGLTAPLIPRRFLAPSATIQPAKRNLRQTIEFLKSSLPQRVTKSEESRKRMAGLSDTISNPGQTTHRSARVPGCARA